MAKLTAAQLGTINLRNLLESKGIEIRDHRVETHLKNHSIRLKNPAKKQEAINLATAAGYKGVGIGVHSAITVPNPEYKEPSSITGSVSMHEKAKQLKVILLASGIGIETINKPSQDGSCTIILKDPVQRETAMDQARKAKYNVEIRGRKGIAVLAGETAAVAARPTAAIAKKPVPVAKKTPKKKSSKKRPAKAPAPKPSGKTKAKPAPELREKTTVPTAPIVALLAGLSFPALKEVVLTTVGSLSPYNQKAIVLDLADTAGLNIGKGLTPQQEKDLKSYASLMEVLGKVKS